MMHAGFRWALLCLAAAAAAAAADEEASDPRLSIPPDDVPAELAFLQPLIRQAASRDPSTHDEFRCGCMWRCMGRRCFGAAAADSSLFLPSKTPRPFKSP